MTTTWNVKTGFATEDLALEFERVEALRKHHEARMRELISTDAERSAWKSEQYLAELAERRGTEILVELNRR